jgi:pilus assembly protein CpaB
MNWKTLIPFVVAIALGAAAITVGKKMLRKQGGIPAGPDLRRVVVATRALEPGYQLQAADLGLTDMPALSLPQGAIADSADIVGRVVAVRIEKGQSVVDSALASRDAGLGLGAIIPLGMRAVTLEVNEHSGMLGLIQPGCHVDVIVTLLDEESRRTIARTIVQNVKVINVGLAPTMPGQKMTAGDGGITSPPKSVTLLCSIKEAEALELATTKGRPRLVLRGGKDDSPVRTAGISIGEVLGAGVRSSAEAAQQGEGAFSQMLRAVAQSTTRPSTQPAEAYVARSAPLLRSVHIIKGGNESVKQFQLVPTVQDSASIGPNE